MFTPLIPNFIKTSRSFLSLKSVDSSYPMTELRERSCHLTPISFNQPLHVPNALACPNIDCNITLPHIYHNLDKQPHQSPDNHLLRLSRFSVDDNPFPRTNCWTVSSKPPLLLCHSDHFFLDEYGVVQLHHILSDRKGLRRWEIFFGTKPGTDIRRVLIIAPKKWALAPKISQFSFHIFAFLYSHIAFYFDSTDLAD